jgi:hypothetical protein
MFKLKYVIITLLALFSGAVLAHAQGLGNFPPGGGSGLPAGVTGGTNPLLSLQQSANGADTLNGARFTDTTPTGTFLNFMNAAKNATLFSVDVLGNATGNSFQTNGAGAGYFQCSNGNGTLPTLVAGAAQISCPSGAITNYQLLLPTAAATGCLNGANAANVVTLSFVTCGSAPAYPVTVTGGVSGAVPCFTSTTVESAGTLLATHALVVGGGAGVCPSTGNADFTYATHTLAGAAAGILDLHLETGDGFVLPNTQCTGTGGTTTLSGHSAGTSELVVCEGVSLQKVVTTGGSSDTITCTNQVLTSVSDSAAPTCTTITAPFLGTVASSTPVTSSNPTINTDQNLIQLPLGTGQLNALASVWEIQAGGIYSSTAASTPVLTFKVKLCTVSGCGGAGTCVSGTCLPLGNIASTALNTAALTNATYNLVLNCVVAAIGATGNLICHGAPGLTLDTGATLSTPDNVFADTNTAVTANIDLTAALFLQFTVAQSVVGGSNSYTQQLAIIKR